MNMDSMTFMLNAISLACGIYCLYTWLKLMSTKKLFKNGLLVPKEKKIEDCLDEDAYIAAILPPLSVLAISTTLYGAFFMINDSLAQPLVPYPWSFIPLVLVMAVLIWYAVVNGRANRDYWGM